jgi:phosphoribosylformimino-5-aminoimidazole carboxamide ribotide isomerase
MELIPAVDVLGGRVVRLLRGDYDEVTVYDHDPVARAARWIEAGAPVVHVVDLDGARTGRSDGDLWRELGKAGIRFQVGGGIRDRETAERAVAAGAARVVMGTTAVWDPEVLADVITALGPDRVVAALDVMGGRATGAGWRDEGPRLGAVVTAAVAAGVRRVLATGNGRDGSIEGPDLDVVSEIRTVAPDLAIQGSGGVGTLDDLRAFVNAGVEGVIVGRALYENRFTVEQALEVAG